MEVMSPTSCRDQGAQANSQLLPELSVASMSRHTSQRRDFFTNLTNSPSFEKQAVKIKTHELAPDINARRQHSNLPYTFDYRSSPSPPPLEIPRIISYQERCEGLPEAMRSQREFSRKDINEFLTSMNSSKSIIETKRRRLKPNKSPNKVRSPIHLKRMTQKQFQSPSPSPKKIAPCNTHRNIRQRQLMSPEPFQKNSTTNLLAEIKIRVGGETTRSNNFSPNKITKSKQQLFISNDVYQSNLPMLNVIFVRDGAHRQAKYK